MPRFYFHRHDCDAFGVDREGVDLPDRESAIVRAMRSGWAYRAEEALAGRVCEHCHIEIEDPQGERIRVPFRPEIRQGDGQAK